MKKLKQRWGIRSNFHLLIIFVVFGITGSLSALLAEPLTHWFGLTPGNTNQWIILACPNPINFPNLSGYFVICGFCLENFNFFGTLKRKCYLVWVCQSTN